MPTGSAELDVSVPADRVLAALADLEGWTGWVPGLLSVLRDGPADAVVWSVETPLGPAHVPLQFHRSDHGVRFRPRPDEPFTGPFTDVRGEVAVVDGRLSFELTLAGTPEPPEALPTMVARGALDALARRLAERPPAAPSGELVSVPMSDGVSLAALLFPAAAVSAPFVVAMTPYRKDGAFTPQVGQLLNDAGFHFLAADVRGFGGSVAPYEGLLSEREVDDYAELVEWAAVHPLGTGAVATFGASYLGANQLLVAGRRPRGLRCIAPVVAPIDTYRDWTHRGGIPTHTLWGAMTYLNSQHPSTARSGIAQYYDLQINRCDDDGHRRRSPESVLDRIEVPALVAGGWHDYFLRPTVRAYQRITAPKRLVIGPWGHGDFSPILQEEIVSWYRRWLLDDPAAGPDGGVRLYRTGADEWLERASWPESSTLSFHVFEPVAAPTTVKVHTHLMGVPMAPNPKPQFVPDPTDSGMGLWGEADTFDSDPLPSSLDVEGPVVLRARLTVTGGCTDVDVHARVSVVSATGAATQLTEGRLRASHRAVDRDRSLLDGDGEIVVPWHRHVDEAPLVDGEPVDLVIEVHPVCHRFRAGERIRLGLTVVRADEGSVPVVATLDPSTALLLPLAPEDAE